MWAPPSDTPPKDWDLTAMIFWTSFVRCRGEARLNDFPAPAFMNTQSAAVRSDSADSLREQTTHPERGVRSCRIADFSLYNRTSPLARYVKLRASKADDACSRRSHAVVLSVGRGNPHVLVVT